MKITRRHLTVAVWALRQNANELQAYAEGMPAFRVPGLPAALPAMFKRSIAEYESAALALDPFCADVSPRRAMPLRADVLEFIQTHHLEAIENAMSAITPDQLSPRLVEGFAHELPAVLKRSIAEYSPGEIETTRDAFRVALDQRYDAECHVENADDGEGHLRGMEAFAGGGMSAYNEARGYGVVEAGPPCHDCPGCMRCD